MDPKELWKRVVGHITLGLAAPFSCKEYQSQWYDQERVPVLMPGISPFLETYQIPKSQGGLFSFPLETFPDGEVYPELPGKYHRGDLFSFPLGSALDVEELLPLEITHEKTNVSSEPSLY